MSANNGFLKMFLTTVLISKFAMKTYFSILKSDSTAKQNYLKYCCTTDLIKLDIKSRMSIVKGSWESWNPIRMQSGKFQTIACSDICATPLFHSNRKVSLVWFKFKLYCWHFTNHLRFSGRWTLKIQPWLLNNKELHIDNII